MFFERLYNFPLHYELIIDNEESYENENSYNNSIDIWSELEIAKISEIKSKNKNLIQEKDIKFELYPLYINLKKIESKLLYNSHYNIFKVFGYFGSAIYNILIDAFPNNEIFYKSKYLLIELLLIYKENYNKDEIKENIFYKKLIKVYDEVVSLIKNKIIIFKEISIFIVVMKLYETYFITIDDKEKLKEVLKFQFMILSYITDKEYIKIYNTFFKTINMNKMRYLSKNKYKFSPNKKSYINTLRKIYKLTKQESEENEEK